MFLRNSVKAPQIQKGNHGILLRAEMRNLQLFSETVIQKKRLSKELLTDTEERKLETACNHLRSISETLKFWQ